jgi:hypothetical protein
MEPTAADELSVLASTSEPLVNTVYIIRSVLSANNADDNGDHSGVHDDGGNGHQITMTRA